MAITLPAAGKKGETFRYRSPKKRVLFIGITLTSVLVLT